MRTRYHVGQQIVSGLTVTNVPMPGFAAIDRRLARLRSGLGSSEIHGAMTGYLCGGGSSTQEDWLTTLHLEGEEARAPEDVHDALARLAAATAAAVRAPDEPLELLLPEAESGLEARALALVDWCRGFLGGFGLAGIDRAALKPGLEAILGDFVDIAATVPDMGAADEDAAALSELVDHVRFGVRVLYAALRPAAPAPGP